MLSTGHEEARGAYNGVAIVKLMGRHSGFIAAMAAVANGDANFVLVPEVPFDMDGEKGFLRVIELRLESRDHALIVVAEGAGQNLILDESAKKKYGLLFSESAASASATREVMLPLIDLILNEIKKICSSFPATK